MNITELERRLGLIKTDDPFEVSTPIKNSPISTK